METSAADSFEGTSSWRNQSGGILTALISHALAHQQGHLFPWLAVGLGSGIGVFFSLRFEPGMNEVAAIAFGVAAIGAAIRLGPATIRPIFWLIAVVLCGIVIASLRTHSIAAPVLGFRYYGPIEGRIIAIDRSASQKVRLTLDQVRLDRMSPDRTPKKVRVSLHGDQPFLTPKPGAMVAMTGHLSPPSGPTEPGGFDFQRMAWFQQLGAVGYTRVPALRLAPARTNTWSLRLYAMRKTLAAGIKDKMGGREGPFASAIITGDRADIDQDALVDLRASNLAHLLAISGLHMGLLTGAVLALLRVGLSFAPRTITRVAPKKIAAVGALIAATLYLGVSGASIATQRAYIMAAVMLVAICLDRRALTLRAVTVAALIVLLWRPESLIGPGFQMSFAATVALVAVFAALRETELMYKLPSWARGAVMLVMSSGVAGLATAPFGAAHFNQIAHYGLFANLFSVPVMGFVIMPGAILAAVLWPLGLDWIGLEIMQAGLAWILGVAQFVADQDGSTRLVIQPPTFVLPLVALGGAFLCIWQEKWRLAGLVPVFTAFFLWGQAERPDVLISESGLLIGAQTPTGRAFNKPKGDGFTARSWLENDADRSTQDNAAKRGLADRNFGEINLNGEVIRYDMRKEISPDQLRELCRGAALIIVPKIKANANCSVLSQTEFRSQGSVAISQGDNDMVLETANARRGTRIWVSR